MSILRIINLSPQVTTENKTIIISGIRSSEFIRAINKYWKTSRVEKYLFKSITWRSLISYEFYALELESLLVPMINDFDSRFRVPRHTLNDIVEQLQQNTWLANRNKPLPPIDYSGLNRLNVKLLPDQVKFIETYIKTTTIMSLNGLMLAADPGTGKTIASLGLKETLNIKRVIVICPKPAIDLVWVSTVKSRYHTPKQYWTPNLPIDKLTPETEFIIINYEYIEKLKQLLPRLGKNLSDFGVILDEAHYLNNFNSDRTIQFLSLCLSDIKSKHIVSLTGTPIKAESVEVIPLLRAIDPLFTPKVEESFKKLFGGEANKATTILRNRVSLIQHRVYKDLGDVKPPELIDYTVTIPNGDDYTLEAIRAKMVKFVEERTKHYDQIMKTVTAEFEMILSNFQKSLNPKENQAYQEYRADLKIVIRSGGDPSSSRYMQSCNTYERQVIGPKLSPEVKKRFNEIKSIVKYPKLKIMGECLGQIVGRARIECHIDIAKNLEISAIFESTLKKTLIFSNYTEVILALGDKLTNDGYKIALVYSDTSKKLNEIVNNYRDDPNLNPLIATYASLSTAVPLIMADTMVCIDVAFRSYIMEQAIARIYRLGQTNQTRVYYIKLSTGEKPNISQRTYDILAWAQKEVEMITGISAPFEFSDKNTETQPSVESFDNYDKLEYLTIEQVANKLNDW